MTETDENTRNLNSKKGNISLDEDLGYSFFPERQSALSETEGEVRKYTLWDRFKDHLWLKKTDREHCEKKVVECLNSHPMVQIAVRALKASGCLVDFRRHISCEKCYVGVNGGFDTKSNQVVLCENNPRLYKVACGVLAHELLHALDKCRYKLDFNDPRHIACTEIRAAALTGCTYYTAWRQGDFTTDYKNKHMLCTKHQAIESLRAVKNISFEEAVRIVDSVFVKCYKDTEPYGRIPQRKCRDMDKILSEGSLHGYTP